jgi:hypothetical protein
VEFTATLHSESEVLSGELVSGNYFPLLGIKAAAGRVFNSNDDLRASENPVAVLSYECWKSRFAADGKIIGRTLLINNYPLTIIGISQPGFTGLEPGLPTQLFERLWTAETRKDAGACKVGLTAAVSQNSPDRSVAVRICSRHLLR